MGSLTRFSAQTDASKRSYGSSKMSSSVWDEVGSRFREKVGPFLAFKRLFETIYIFLIVKDK